MEQIPSLPYKKMKVEILDEDLAIFTNPDCLGSQMKKEIKIDEIDLVKSLKSEDEKSPSDIANGQGITYTVSIVTYRRSYALPNVSTFIIKNQKNEIVFQKSKGYRNESKMVGVMTHLRKAIEFCLDQKVSHIEILHDLDLFEEIFGELNIKRGGIHPTIKKNQKIISRLLNKFTTHKWKWTLKSSLDEAYELSKDWSVKWMASLKYSEHHKKDRFD